MAGRLKNEDMIRLVDTPRVVYEMTGVSRKLDTVRKWASKGVLGANGTRVTLRTRKRITGIYTTRAWLAEFFSGV